MIIKVEIKQNFGKDVVYPICKEAKLFALIAGTETLTSLVLKRIQCLGYEIIEVQSEKLQNFIN